MAFGDNSTLVTTADRQDVELDGNNDIITLTNPEADTLYFGNGNAGDEQIVGFGKNDSILNYKQIFDGNGDGIVSFGANGILDIDRTSSRNAGSDQITILGMIGGALRYLGVKEGLHAYADASVRLADFTEGFVTNDVFDANGGNRNFFYDTALGLNLGADTINNFGVGDRIVTTTRIHNGSDAGAAITFGANGVYDLPGDTDGTQGDVGPSQGGQLDIVGVNRLWLMETETENGVTYYYYGLQDISA